MSHKLLPIFYCLLTDFPGEDNQVCDYFPNGTINTGNCFKCHTPAKYLFGGVVDDPSSPGLKACLVIWLLILLMGACGMFGNGLIIWIMRKRKRPTSFDFLLYVLASIDLLNSIMAMTSTTAVIFFLGNWSRGLMTLTCYHSSMLILFFGKSISAYLTVFITVERYLVIANPMKSASWFTAAKTRFMVTGVIILAIIFNIPRSSSVKIVYNQDGRNITCLKDREYIILSTVMEQFWYKTMRSVHYVDILAPFPLLLVFNVLLYIKIQTFIKSHKLLTKKQKMDIRAARMFVPVVIMLFFCNVEPIATYLVMGFQNVCYRELVFGSVLSVAVNSAVNLPIYYAKGSSFREELKDSLPEWLKSCLRKSTKSDGYIVGTGTGTNTGSETTKESDIARENVYFVLPGNKFFPMESVDIVQYNYA